jgi:hypothetical protein
MHIGAASRIMAFACASALSGLSGFALGGVPAECRPPPSIKRQLFTTQGVHILDASAIWYCNRAHDGVCCKHLPVIVRINAQGKCTAEFPYGTLQVQVRGSARTPLIWEIDASATPDPSQYVFDVDGIHMEPIGNPPAPLPVGQPAGRDAADKKKFLRTDTGILGQAANHYPVVLYDGGSDPSKQCEKVDPGIVNTQ